MSHLQPKSGRIETSDDFWNLIEGNKDIKIFFTSERAPKIADLVCPICVEGEYYSVVACASRCGEDKSCSDCSIIDFVGVYHLPVVTIFRHRVLKARFYPTDRILRNSECRFCDNKKRLEKYEQTRVKPLMNDAIFHIMNWMSLWVLSPTLNDLWHAQGLRVVVLRTTNQPRKTWKRCFNGKKDEWRAYGIMASLILTAATGLLASISDAVPRLLCLASIACNLGSTIGATTLLTRFQNVNAMRLAWFEGGALFVMALSAPGAWLRWGIITFLGALLSHLWKSQPLAINLVILILVTIHFIFFVYQSYFFRDDSQFFNVARPLRIDQFPGDTLEYPLISSGSRMPSSADKEIA